MLWFRIIFLRNRNRTRNLVPHIWNYGTGPGTGTGTGTGTRFGTGTLEPEPEPDASGINIKKDPHFRKTNYNKQRRFFSLIYTSCCIIWNVTMFNKSLWSLQIPIPIKVALTKIFQRKYFLWILRKDFITAFFLNKSANLIVKRILKITTYQIK